MRVGHGPAHAARPKMFARKPFCHWNGTKAFSCTVLAAASCGRLGGPGVMRRAASCNQQGALHQPWGRGPLQACSVAMTPTAALRRFISARKSLGSHSVPASAWNLPPIPVRADDPVWMAGIAWRRGTPAVGSVRRESHPDPYTHTRFRAWMTAELWSPWTPICPSAARASSRASTRCLIRRSKSSTSAGRGTSSRRSRCARRVTVLKGLAGGKGGEGPRSAALRDPRLHPHA